MMDDPRNCSGGHPFAAAFPAAPAAGEAGGKGWRSPPAVLRAVSWLVGVVAIVTLASALTRPPVRLPPPGGDRQVEDMRHRKLSLASPFPGAMLLFPPLMAEYFLAGDAPETVLATTMINHDSLGGGLLGEHFPRIGQLAADHAFPTPHAVNLEAAMAARPGIIFIMGWLAPPLDAIGLPTAAVTSAQREEMILANAALFAKTAGKPERAQRLADDFHRAMERTSRELGPLAEADRPRLLDLTIMADGAIRVQGPQSLSSRLMTLAGGRNALSGGLAAPRLSAEHILSLDPDVILLSTASSVRNAGDFAAMAPWTVFPASRRGRVYRSPDGLARGMGGVVETPLQVRWLAELLHPDRLSPRLREWMQTTYGDALNFTLSEDQLDRALSLRENRGMAHYERFARAPAGESTP